MILKHTFIARTLIVAGFFALAAGCSTSQKFEGNSGVAPAAAAEIKTSKSDNGNTNVEVKVKHLAQPEKLANGASVFVLWLKPDGAVQFQNMGAFNVNSSLEGNYELKIPHKTFSFMITPEATASVQTPMGRTVFEGIVQ